MARKQAQNVQEAEIIDVPQTKEIVTHQANNEVVVGESGLTNKQVQVLSKTILKNFTADEMGLTFHMAKAIGANLFARELWAFKDNRGNLVNIISRDFLKKKAYENPEFSSFHSGAVFEKDEFEINIATGHVNHLVKNAFDLKARGKLVGAWCVGNFRDGTKVAYLADLAVYKPKNPNQFSPWSDQDTDMIIKCAEAVILKKFARLGNVYTEEEIGNIRTEKQEYTKPEKPDAKRLSNALIGKQ